MKTKGVIKLIIIVIILAAAVFGGVNLFWYGARYLPYKKMAANMQFNDDPEMPRYVCTDELYMYRLKMPSYLSFDSGFLYVGPADEDAALLREDEYGGIIEENVPHVDMFIWPQIFSGAEYGVTVYEKTYSVQLMVNSLGEYLPDENISEEERAENTALFEKHRDEIRDVMRAAREMWDPE